MRKSKLIDICRSLKTEEWRLLGDFVASPYYNKSREVIRLYQHLYVLAKGDFPEKTLDPRAVWKHIFPRKPFDKKPLAYLMSDLLRLIEDFLGDLYRAARPERQELAVLAALSERKLAKNYGFRLRKLKRKLTTYEQRDTDYYHLQYTLAGLEDDHFNTQNIRQVNPFPQARNVALDHYFMQSKLRLFCKMLNLAAVLGSDYELSWPTDPQNDSSPPEEDPLTEAYRCLFQMLNRKEPNDRLFDQYNLMLSSLNEMAGDDDRINLYFIAINYCLQAIKKGRREYADKLLTLYQNGLSSGNLLVKEELSPWMYKNIIKLSLGLKRFEWAERFITEYSDRLPEGDRHDALYFNLSDLSYHQKQYDTALAYLNQIEFSDIFYKHGTKIMLLKIYFEKHEAEAFFNLAGSYRLMLLREKGLSTATLTAYKNFVRLAVKLFRARERRTIDREKLAGEIQRTKNINARQWLLEQIKVF